MIVTHFEFIITSIYCILRIMFTKSRLYSKRSPEITSNSAANIEVFPELVPKWANWIIWRRARVAWWEVYHSIFSGGFARIWYNFRRLCGSLLHFGLCTYKTTQIDVLNEHSIPILLSWLYRCKFNFPIIFTSREMLSKSPINYSAKHFVFILT